MDAQAPFSSNRSTLASAGSALPNDLSGLLASLEAMPLERLRLTWRNHLGGAPPPHLPRWLMFRLLAYRLQAQAHGGLDKATLAAIKAAQRADGSTLPFRNRPAATREGTMLAPGSLLVREWNGRLERVMAMEEGFAWNGTSYRSLSQVAKAITGTNWNGHRFFGLRKAGGKKPAGGSRR